jgi:hypothetical protein
MRRVGIALRSIRRESAHGLGHALAWFASRFYRRFIRRVWPALPAPTAEDVATPIAVVIPAAEKDADALPHCLESVRRHILHPLAAVWVVAPNSSRVREIARAHDAEWIHEDDLLPRPAAVLNTRGWVLQQLIKLNAAGRTPAPDYLVMDSDTVFLRAQLFRRGGRAVLRYSDQYELRYNRSLELVFGTRRRFPVSFVTHHMLFQRHHVEALRARIEQRFARPWWDAILRVLDREELISFSEYELYGHQVISTPHWSRSAVLEYWNGWDMDGADLPNLPSLAASAPLKLNTISFHRHTQ